MQADLFGAYVRAELEHWGTLPCKANPRKEGWLPSYGELQGMTHPEPLMHRE